MSKRVMFDTLGYAKMLKTGGVECAEVHAASLSTVLAQNLYAKIEVDHMLERAFRKSDEARAEADRKWVEDRARSDREFAKLELRLEKSINRSFVAAISILGTLIVVMNAISAFAHYIFH